MNYQTEIPARLAGMTKEQIEEMAKSLEWTATKSTPEHVFESRFGRIYYNTFRLNEPSSHFYFDYPLSEMSWLPTPSVSHAKAAFAIFLALVKRDLPDIELPYVEGVDCPVCEGGKTVIKEGPHPLMKDFHGNPMVGPMPHPCPACQGTGKAKENR